MNPQSIATRPERESLESILKRPAYIDRFKQVLGERGMQFCSSILSVGRTMPDVEPKSIVASAMIAATLDLPIEKNLGFAWLVAYNSKEGKVCQFQMGYKGYIQLALRTGRYERMNARAINEEALGGYDEVGEPIILWDKIDETKPAVGYAFGFKLTGGFTKVCYWPKAKVQEHAKRYSQAFRSGRGGPWETHFDQMALKTVISNELSDWGILSIQWQQARTYDQAVVPDLGAEARYVDNTSAIDVEASSPAPTAFQQSQQTTTTAPALPTPAQTPPPPVKRGPGRPPKTATSPMPRTTGEKLSPAEADELKQTGVAVAPEAVTPEAKTEEAELASIGLAPEPTPTAAPEPEPAKPEFVPIEGEPEALTNLRRVMFNEGVTEEQVMKFNIANKIATTEKTLADFVGTGRTVKLAQLATAFKVIKPKIVS